MAKQPTLQCRAAVLEAQSNGSCYMSRTESEQRQLKRMVKRGELVSPISGLFASSSWWMERNPNERALAQIRGLANKHPSWVFCEMSAALVFGLWVPYEASDKIHVLTSRNAQTKDTSHIVRHPSDCLDFVEVNGIRVTPLERTVFDCCRSHPVRKCLGIADSALRIANRDAIWLRNSFESYSRHHKGWKQATYVASLADGLSENGGESLARATMIMLGFMTPKLQVEVPNLIDGGSYRVDFLWELPDGTKVAGELDGHEKYFNPEMTGSRNTLSVLSDERLRESRINALRIPVMRFSLSDVRNTARFARLLETFGIPRTRRQSKADVTMQLNLQVIKLGRWDVTFEVIEAAA